jgi:pilus assembly protein CpaF
VIVSFEIILPFLRPIAGFLQDEHVSEIMVNPGGRVFIERNGRMQRVEDAVVDERNLQVAVRNIARLLGSDISEEQPILDARLPDGSRVAAVIPPCSLRGTALTIRKFRPAYFTLEELVKVGTLSQWVAEELAAAVHRRDNILISGGTGTGKTTLLNALTGCIDEGERLVVVEETAELRIGLQNLVRLEERRAQRDLAAVTMRELLRATLRHRPDRILIGEVRGGEAYDLLQALNTGHAGALCTIHASSATQALSRLASCVLQSGVDLPYTAVRQQVGDAIQMVVHLQRRDGRRLASEVLAVARYDAASDQYLARQQRLLS